MQPRFRLERSVKSAAKLSGPCSRTGIYIYIYILKTPAAAHRRPPATYCRPSWFKQCGGQAFADSGWSSPWKSLPEESVRRDEMWQEICTTQGRPEVISTVNCTRCAGGGFHVNLTRSSSPWKSLPGRSRKMIVNMSESIENH